jgi:hypothetical protein
VGSLFEGRTGDTQSDTRRIMFTLSVVNGLKPRDELESMQLTQMAGVHEVLMRLIGEFAQAKDEASRDSAARGIAQLARVYTAQFEAFKRHRNGVQDVSVAEGGQAIADNVTRADHEVAQTIPPLTYSRQAAMEIIDEREPVLLRRAKSA